MKSAPVTIAFLTLAASYAIAEQSTLIDFDRITRDTQIRTTSTDNDEHEQTLVDFSGLAGSSFADEDLAQMRISLAIPNWDVQLSSSSATPGNTTRSFTREAQVKDTAKPFNGEEMAGRQVMGIRVRFPEASFNAFARVQPPFEIPAFGETSEDQFVEFGVVKNVGIIKEVEATVYGSNFPNGFALLLVDSNGVERQIFMDNLQFDGWRTLRWRNPNYIADVRNREIRPFPLYPNSAPFIKLGGFMVYRDSQQAGGDMVTYVKDVRLTYDVALLETQRDIDDEAIWGILEQRQEARKRAELRRLGNLQVLRYLERQKLDTTLP